MDGCSSSHTWASSSRFGHGKLLRNTVYPTIAYIPQVRISTFGELPHSWVAISCQLTHPQLSKSIKADMHLSQNEIANSNIIALTATLLVRAIAGPMCDHIGPRLTFASLLFVGAIPTALAGTAHNAMGLYFIRFFVGILGGTFVPCQVWTTGFFDKNVIGTANALVGGWGNSGGGIT
jgi:nitrate/nitrite transporter NarK